MYKNLEITFDLASEMVLPIYPIPFEALITKAKALQLNLPLDRFEENIEIPIAKHDILTDLYLASVSFIEASGRYKQFFTKRYDGKLEVNRGSGYFRNYFTQLNTIIPPIRVTFYCKGLKEEIEELCHYIPALGAFRRQGYGKVGKVTVREINEEKYWIYENKPMRAIPIHYDETKLSEWFYAPCNPVPPSYTTHQTEICYLPRPTDWLHVAVPAQPEAPKEVAVDVEPPKQKVKKTGRKQTKFDLLGGEA